MVGVRGDGLGKTRTGQNKTRAGQARHGRRVAGKVPAGRDVRSRHVVVPAYSTFRAHVAGIVGFGIWADERM
jgi:hypothetical protein